MLLNFKYPNFHSGSEIRVRGRKILSHTPFSSKTCMCTNCFCVYPSSDIKSYVSVSEDTETATLRIIFHSWTSPRVKYRRENCLIGGSGSWKVPIKTHHCIIHFVRPRYSKLRMQTDNYHGIGLVMYNACRTCIIISHVVDYEGFSFWSDVFQVS